MEDEEEELNSILRLTPETLFIDKANGLSVKVDRCPFLQIYFRDNRQPCVTCCLQRHS